ncbi:hypothetical protein F5X96DRAFT_215715 [Biscogniauxia mediterranea]|nr:hypothetical protein F5X96DRAFT_215715 [Biscogniauxia mediterranea]
MYYSLCLRIKGIFETRERTNNSGGWNQGFPPTTHSRHGSSKRFSLWEGFFFYDLMIYTYISIYAVCKREWVKVHSEFFAFIYFIQHFFSTIHTYTISKNLGKRVFLLVISATHMKPS